MNPASIPQTCNDRDLLIPDLVHDLFELRAALDDAHDERATYRALAQVALGEAHRLTVLVRRLTARVREQQGQIAELLRLEADEAAA